MTHLLDTNPIIEHLRDPLSPISVRLDAMPAGSVAVCSVVVAELIRGVLKTPDPAQNQVRVDEFLADYPSLAFDDPAAHDYARLTDKLEAAGAKLQLHDLMIAAVALSHGLTMVTHNTRDFARVPGLRIEDWQTP